MGEISPSFEVLSRPEPRHGNISCPVGPPPYDESLREVTCRFRSLPTSTNDPKREAGECPRGSLLRERKSRLLRNGEEFH